jgi:hypothetical protein
MTDTVCSPAKYRKITSLALSWGDREWLVCLVRVSRFSHLLGSRGRSHGSSLTLPQVTELAGVAHQRYACAVLRSPHPKQTP